MTAKSKLESIGYVRLITLDDDAKRNAIGNELAAELVQHATEIAVDPDAHAVVIVGKGQAFCAGADLEQVFGSERPTWEMQTALATYYKCFLSVRALEVPTFAAINGAAVGAGLNLALACDIRIASPAATLGVTFTRIGLHPGGGCTAFLVSELGRQKAADLLLSGATLTAEEARDLGLVAAIAEDPLAEALERAERVAELEPWLARSVLRGIDLAATSTFESVVGFESWAQAESTHNPRFRAWVEKYATTTERTR